MKNIFLLSVIFLIACTSNLPSKSREISDFIPKEKLKIVYTIEEGKKFVKENFPKNCRWEKLERVVDGDTIVTKKSGKIRLIGINTPEVKSPFTEEEPGGKEASAKIRGILTSVEEVCLIHDPIGDQIDKYGRSLDYVFLHDGTDINAEMIKTGHARWYPPFPYSRKGEFKIYQNSAKKAEVGLWE